MTLAHREAGSGEDVVLCVHGYPETSYMWREVLDAAAQAGWRGVAPDLMGFGDSPPDPPATWERHVEALEALRQSLGLGRVVLVVHDWGGLIGLRWACDHPDAVRGLVIANSGFFPDGKWHGMAKSLRTEGEGEAMMDAMTPELLGQALSAISPGIGDEAVAEYGRFLDTADGRRGVLELYRSGDFEKLEPYRGRLAALGVPTLLLWGADDPFAPVAGAHRFAKEIPHATMHVIEGAGHFVFADAPEEAAAQVRGFLESF